MLLQWFLSPCYSSIYSLFFALIHTLSHTSFLFPLSYTDLTLLSCFPKYDSFYNPNSLTSTTTTTHTHTLHHTFNYTVDVHHGNGTEETIRWLSPGLETSEIVTPMGFGTLSAPRYKPWYGENDAGKYYFV